MPCSEPQAQLANCKWCSCPAGLVCMSGTCATDPRTVIATSEQKIESRILLDDGYVYWTTRAPAGGYTNDVTFSINRVPKSGGTSNVVFALDNSQIDMVAYDSSAHYIKVWRNTDTTSGNAWDAIIARIAYGATAYTLLIDNFNTSVAPDLLAQTSSTLYFENWFYQSDTNWLVGVDPPGGTGAPQWTQQVTGKVGHATVEGDVVRLVFGPFNGKLSLYSLSRNTGLVKGATLPEQCYGIVRDSIEHDWIGVCGSVPLDVVRFSDSGAMQTIATGIVDATSLTLRGTELYWRESKTRNIRSFDLQTKQTKTIPLQKEDVVFAYDDAYVYYVNSTQILRTAFATASSP